MADAMVIASLRAEIAQIRAEKDAEISKLRYDVALERGEKERLAKTGRELTAAVAALEGQLRTTEELLDLERARCARMSEALHKARTMRDNADRVRHQMQRGVTVAFNQLQRSAVALEVEMKDLFAGLNERPGHDFDVDLGARDLDEPRSAAPPVEPTSSAPYGTFDGTFDGTLRTGGHERGVLRRVGGRGEASRRGTRRRGDGLRRARRAIATRRRGKSRGNGPAQSRGERILTSPGFEPSTRGIATRVSYPRE